MPSCEKCWADAYGIALEAGKTQTDCYFELLEERKDNPCSPQEQAGQWWDEKQQRDKRLEGK